MAYTAIDVARRAALLRDLRNDDTGAMLAYCAQLLQQWEHAAAVAVAAEAHRVASLSAAGVGEASDWIPVSEAARRLRRPRKTLYAAIDRGRLLGRKLAGEPMTVRWSQAAAIRWKKGTADDLRAARLAPDDGDRSNDHRDKSDHRRL